MARQIAPGTPPEITAKQYKVDTPDWSAFEKLGDAKITAANNNFKLYAEALIGEESAKLYNQYKTDPVNLANALGKLPDMLKDLPQEIQDEMNKKLYLNGVALVSKAQNNQITLEDAQNKKYADYGIVSSKDGMLATYGNVLQNHISKAEDKNPVMNDIFLQQIDNLQKLSELKNSQGLDVYSPTQKKTIRNIADVELEGFKQFVDSMIINDDDKLTRTTEYYQKYVLAPERFMSENYMDRPTYEKARQYISKTMRDAGVKIQGIKFQQSIKEATELQVADLPGKLESLRESGLIDKSIVDQIEKTNVKFNEIDPSKIESPIAMINMLQIMNQQRYNPAPTTNDEQQKVLEQGTATLDAIADYAQTYGLSPKSVKTSRETVANLETNTAFSGILSNFNDIITNFEPKLEAVRRRSTGKDKGKNLILSGMSDAESIKLIRLNNMLAESTDLINQEIRNGNWDNVRKIQKDTQRHAAQLKYDWIKWSDYDQNPDKVFTTPNGRAVKIKDFTTDGDVLFEVVE